jgi:hypothetical protein
VPPRLLSSCVCVLRAMPARAWMHVQSPTSGVHGRCLRFAPQDAGTGKGWEKREAIIGSAKHLLDKLAAKKSKTPLVPPPLRGECVGDSCSPGGGGRRTTGEQSPIGGRPDGGSGVGLGPQQDPALVGAHQHLRQPAPTRARAALPPPPKRRDKFDAVGVGEGMQRERSVAGGKQNETVDQKGKHLMLEQRGQRDQAGATDAGGVQERVQHTMVLASQEAKVGAARKSPGRERVDREEDGGLNGAFQHASSSALAMLGLRWNEEVEQAGRGGGGMRTEDSVLSTGSMTDGSSFEMMV